MLQSQDKITKKSYILSINQRATEIRVGDQQDRKRRSERSWYYLGTAGQMGMSIAAPIVLGGLTGSFIDKKTGSYPVFTLGLLAVGIILSVVTFSQIIRDLLKHK